MKNADMPAMPLANDATGRPYIFSDGEQANPGHAIGLTKREEFARAAMMGILADSNDECVTDPVLVAREAVNYADALLAELANTNEE